MKKILISILALSFLVFSILEGRVNYRCVAIDYKDCETAVCTDSAETKPVSICSSKSPCSSKRIIVKKDEPADRTPVCLEFAGLVNPACRLNCEIIPYQPGVTYFGQRNSLREIDPPRLESNASTFNESEVYLLLSTSRPQGVHQSIPTTVLRL
jgi:hypothetical protein